MNKQKYVTVTELNSENKMLSNKCMCGEIVQIEISFSLKEDQFQSSTERKRMCFACGSQLESALRDVNLGRD